MDLVLILHVIEFEIIVNNYYSSVPCSSIVK